MMALSQALQALAIDAMLPGLGVIARDLGASDPNQRQLIIGVFMIGIGIGSLVPGTLADRYGRRPVFLSCLFAYVVLAFACALVTRFDVLIGLRFAQALASGGLSVLPAAIIRDRLDGDRMARLLSLITMVFLVVPMVAPSLGQVVLVFAGWRWIFGMMGLLGAGIGVWVFARLPETLDPAFRQPILPRTIVVNMAGALTSRAAIGYVLGASLIQGIIWGYIQCSQQLVAEHLGAGDAFPVLFGAMALCMAATNFTNSRIVERFGGRRVSHFALFAFLAVGAAMVALAYRPNQSLWQFILPMTAGMCLMGFIGSNCASIALQPFAKTAGAASSAQACVRTVTASLLGAMIGQAYDGTARPLSLAMLAGGVLSILLVLFSERGRLFRRLTPPGSPRPVAAP